jgi:maleylpyruvate isomerase
MGAPTAHIDLLRRGEAFLFDQLAGLDDTDLAQPCRLPGWSRSHLVAHLARNADALGNLFDWACTGVEHPMYTSAEQRAEGIEASARQDAPALRADLDAASARLVATVDSLPAEAWDAPVRTARGRAITAAEVPWMRIRESWVHAIDLGTGASLADAPGEVVDALLDEVAGGLAGRDDCPSMVLAVTGGSRSWVAGPSAEAVEVVEVTGTAGDLLGWLIGRADGEGLTTSPATTPLPTAPPWL